MGTGIAYPGAFSLAVPVSIVHNGMAMSSDNDEWIDLGNAHFTRGMLAELEQRVVLREFSRYVEEVLGKINDGKEATVYLCRARADVVDGGDALAAKMYRARKFRAFSTESQYADSRYVRDRRMRKAIQGRTKKGRAASRHLWIDREWEALTSLFAAGASVPKPYAQCADGILMEFLGVDGVRAPALAEIRLDPAEAERALASLTRDLEILLDCGYVHGDLSPYNVLYLDGAARMIDLPQAVRIDETPDAWILFHRDVDNLTRYFAKTGVMSDPIDLAARLWR
jgi:RIO kinase 1